MHAVKGCRLGRAQIRADLVDLIVLQGKHTSLFIHGRLNDGLAGRGRGGRLQVLKAVFNPFDGSPARFAGRQAHQNHIREYGLLDAKAPARIAWNLMAQSITRYFERQRHHRVQGKRPHEIGKHVVTLLIWQPLREHKAQLDGGARVSRIMDFGRDGVLRLTECAFDVAIVELAIGDDIGAYLFVQDALTRIECILDAHDDIKRAVLDPNQIQRIFGKIAILRNHDGNGFAAVAHAVHGKRPMLHRLLHAHHKRLRPAPDILTGQHGMHARRGDSGACINLEQLGMAMG